MVSLRGDLPILEKEKVQKYARTTETSVAKNQL
jgi:hypothetical protein